MTGRTVLAVDDEPDILELVRLGLVSAGYEVIAALDGLQALNLAQSKIPSAIVLDLMLPGINGLDLCKILKGHPRTSNIPILILSARDDEADIICALEVGADDYITKPFSPRVLAARVRRLIARKIPGEGGSQKISIGDLFIDPAKHKIQVRGQKVELTDSEFKILHLLANNPGVVFSRSELADALHTGSYVVSDRAIDVLICYLRTKLGSCRDYIETVWGIGYKLTCKAST